MELFDVKVSANGEITIPLEVSRRIGLEAGGIVQFRTEADGRIRVLAKKRSIEALKGLAPRPEVTIDVDAAIALETARRNQPQRSD